MTAAPEAGNAPPKARRGTDVDTIFGVQVADPYRWLEDGKSDEVKAWMNGQDAFARGVLAKLPHREEFVSRLKELAYVETLGIPQHLGKRLFYWRKAAGKEKYAFFSSDLQRGDERVVLDPESWSADGSTSVHGAAVTHDGSRVAYRVSQNNSDEATIKVLDVATGKILEGDTIEGAKFGSPSWLRSGEGFYYEWAPPVSSTLTEADRPGAVEVRFHKIGTNPAKDPLVHEKTNDPTLGLGAYVSRDGRWLFIDVSHGWTRTDLSMLDRTDPHAKFKPLTAGLDAQYSVQAYKDQLYISTNEGAPHWRIFRTDAKHPERSNWKEIIKERSDAILDSMAIVGGKLALSYLVDASSRIELHDLDGKLIRSVALPGIGSSSTFYGEHDDDTAYYSFESFTHPYEVFETKVSTGATKTWSQVHVAVDPSKFEVEQIFAKSKDGTRVPLFIVHAKGLVKDGSAPTMLYGYGGFQVNMTPWFSGSIATWIEHGGVYAVAVLRGGGEYGETWHRDGMLHKKQNVFDDFIAASEALVATKYTSPEHLAIEGASNGGLLMGAMTVQRPDLFRAVLCGVPLLDMVRFTRFGGGKTWTPEYGTPENEDDFKVLYAYSPYHHVQKGTRYPSLLMLSADSDDRVDPLHARKMVAALQDATTGGPVLLRIEKNSGHGGADLVKAAVEERADVFAFALHELTK